MRIILVKHRSLDVCWGLSVLIVHKLRLYNGSFKLRIPKSKQNDLETRDDFVQMPVYSLTNNVLLSDRLCAKALLSAINKNEVQTFLTQTWNL